MSFGPKDKQQDATTQPEGATTLEITTSPAASKPREPEKRQVMEVVSDETTMDSQDSIHMSRTNVSLEIKGDA